MKLEFLRKRILLERSVREYFHSLGFDEVRTPLLVKSPGMEPHIRPLQVRPSSGTKKAFLPTSPEFGMKKLLSQGLDRIFQIAPAFRDEPVSPEHHPEFTLLEFYEAEIPLDLLQERVEGLFRHLSHRLHHSLVFSFRNRTIDLAGPWPRFRVPDLFQSALGIDLRTHARPEDLHRVCAAWGLPSSPEEPWDDLYFKLWLNAVEPVLPLNQPCFVTHYPLSQSSLCNPIVDETGYSWANRFEVYVGRMELGNAFDELRDPLLQRQNFLKDQKIRAAAYGDGMPESPIDEELLSALPRMKPTCGIALGLDRLILLLTDAEDLSEVLYLPSWW